MSNYTSVDNKVLFRIDFKPTLKYFDQMFKIASSLEGEYEHWKAARSPVVGTLYDSDTKKQLNISPQSISFTTKNEEMLRNPFDEISKIILLFLSETDVKLVGRIGVRRQGIKNVNKNYQVFTDLFFDAFYNSKSELKKIYADSVEDTVLIFQGIKDGFNNRCQFGPLKEEQLELLYGIEEFEGGSNIDLNKKTAVLVDTDVYYLAETDLDESLLKIKDILSLSEKMYENTWKLIEEKI